MFAVALYVFIGILIGCAAPYILNRKKNQYEAEDLEVLGRMEFLDAFTRGWDDALEASRIRSEHTIIFKHHEN